jgi:acetyl-CoA carboxylase carboxyltransferase component
LYRIESKIDTGSAELKANYEAYQQLVGQLRQRLNDTIHGASSSSVKKHKDRGKLLARERIDLLVDPNAPFLDLSVMAAYGIHNNEFPSAGIVTRFGVIQGHETMIIAKDANVKGGTIIQETIKKHVRAQEIAMENHLPCVYMVDSGGAFLPDQVYVFPFSRRRKRSPPPIHSKKYDIVFINNKNYEYKLQYFRNRNQQSNSYHLAEPA